ncbi:histone-lysine N-methyltransferase SETDB2-like isoform X2 [Varanus komodoensis]|uniref:histone-lysine N-methyltransferase SETDB2-like isoform X2 n=1 Tax=Varanus komodoensis TaxID=61221 RepID=UPI001CF7DB75|nr:histone-lysine N-methyltransferase SETDB2-like isoform X2 [Varanus komodoensis]
MASGALAVDAKMFWTQLEGSKVDLIFEQIQKVLLSLKKKIKDGTATNEEYCQALALVDQVDVTDFLPLKNVNVAKENIQKCKPGFHPLASSEIKENPGDDFSLMEIKEAMHSRSNGEPTEISSTLPSQDHICSKKCLVKRPWDSYRGENPLNLPILCHFQRWNAKKDSASKSYDVMYRAPCGRTLRNFQEVQNYLFQTECNFLFLDHFSFNTYVQVFRKCPSQHVFEFDFDISQGAETVPVSFCNDIDNDQLPYLKYRKASWPHGYLLNNFSSSFLDSCSCTDGCIDRTKCACLILMERSCPEASLPSGKKKCNGYSYKRLCRPLPNGIYECSLLCSCDKKMCQNRLVQHGIQVRLQVFKTEKKGWGVRCLDDIDKGTFVCTYAGKLMHRNEKDTKDRFRSYTLFSGKRKLDIDCSDSETEFIETSKRVQSYICNKNWNNQVIIRSKSRTYSLQNLRELECISVSSEEEESFVREKSGTTMFTAAKKGEEWINKPHNDPLCTDDTHKEMIGRDRQELAHKEAAVEDEETYLKNRENPCLLDATEEGNVGRFLNHSCSPNLFVQSVFVETHNRNFPWVAFFTNRHVKAGTELTWDYGYEPGSMPEKEITCQCGSNKCRKKIL